MKTAELIRNDNVYRAIGGECWLATFEVVSDDGRVRSIKPQVRKVEVHGPNGSCSGLTVRYCSPDGTHGGNIAASRDAVFDDRGHATDAAVELCEAMDGRTIMGQITYRYVRPKARKPKAPPIEVRVRQIGSTAYVVDRRVDGRWKEVRGLGYLTKWKATDTAKRIRCGLDVPGYWMMPGGEEFIELCDYEV